MKDFIVDSLYFFVIRVIFSDYPVIGESVYLFHK